MRILTPVLAILFLVQLSACSEDSGTPATRTDSRVSKDNVFSDQVKALEKAEHLEDQMMDAFKKRNASIDDQ